MLGLVATLAGAASYMRLARDVVTIAAPVATAATNPNPDATSGFTRYQARMRAEGSLPFPARNLPTKSMKAFNLDRWDRVDWQRVDEWERTRDFRREAYDDDDLDVPCRKPSTVLPKRPVKPHRVPWSAGKD